MIPQLIPEHESECLSPAQTKMLYEYMEDEKVVDPVELDLCDYQAIEPVHPFYLLREDSRFPHRGLSVRSSGDR